jgi:arylsulfatase A-like enzyme
MNRRIAAGLVLTSVVVALAVGRSVLGRMRPADPALVMLVTIDQMRSDYLDRFEDQLAGGLARIRERSVFFPNGLHDHGVVQTAPGHASLLSGRFPAHTGILSNDSGVPDAERPLIGSDGEGASPHRFLGTALLDWMRADDPEARVLSVSRKDRGAILPVGRASGHVYWFSDGAFTTSAWYRDALPEWVSAFNARFRVEDWSGRPWTPLLPDSEYPEPDDVPWEAWEANPAFPHTLPTERDDLLDELERFPWTDSLTLAFALEGVNALELGRRGRPDLLAVSLSTLDGVGHHWGPDSREVRDHVLRIDRWLGAFLDSVAVLVPGEILVAFSADHGVAPIPEVRIDRGEDQRGRVLLAAPVREVRDALESRFDSRFALALTSSLVLADTAAMRAAGVPIDSVRDALAARFRSLEGVRRVLTPGDLAAAPEDAEAAPWRHGIPAHVGWLVAVTPEPGWIIGTTRDAQHGPPTPDNMRVPVAFLGPGLPAARHERSVRTVDIAPTLAALLGVRPLEALDGVPLPEVTGRTPISRADRTP